MFSVLKFFYLLFKSFPDLLNIDRNAWVFRSNVTSDSGRT